jgi:formate dehydrogenase maturation protein FdhE
MTNRNDFAEWKTIRIPCKQCAKEFDFRLARDVYEALRTAAEEDGEDLVYAGTCPECKAETEDPFLQLMNKVQARMNER